MGAEQAANIAARVENLRRQAQEKADRDWQVQMADTGRLINDKVARMKMRPGDEKVLGDRYNTLLAQKGLPARPLPNPVLDFIGQNLFDFQSKGSQDLADESDWKDWFKANIDPQWAADNFASLKNQFAVSQMQGAAQPPEVTTGQGATMPSAPKTQETTTGQPQSPLPSISADMGLDDFIGSLMAGHVKKYTQDEAVAKYAEAYKWLGDANATGSPESTRLIYAQRAYKFAILAGGMPKDAPFIATEWFAVKSPEATSITTQSRQQAYDWMNKVSLNKKWDTPEAQGKDLTEWLGIWNKARPDFPLTLDAMKAMVPPVTPMDEATLKGKQLANQETEVDIRQKTAEYDYYVSIVPWMKSLKRLEVQMLQANIGKTNAQAGAARRSGGGRGSSAAAANDFKVAALNQKILQASVQNYNGLEKSRDYFQIQASVTKVEDAAKAYQAVADNYTARMGLMESQIRSQMSPNAPGTSTPAAGSFNFNFSGLNPQATGLQGPAATPDQYESQAKTYLEKYRKQIRTKSGGWSGPVAAAAVRKSLETLGLSKDWAKTEAERLMDKYVWHWNIPKSKTTPRPKKAAGEP